MEDIHTMGKYPALKKNENLILTEEVNKLFLCLLTNKCLVTVCEIFLIFYFFNNKFIFYWCSICQHSE